MELIERLPAFVLVSGRIGAMVMIQPLVGGLSVPIRVRLLLTLALAMLITPVVSLGASAPNSLGGISVALLFEILIGSAMGLMIRMIFTGLELAGQLIAQESGLAFGQIADPSTGQTLSLMSTLYIQLGSVIYLILGGHRAMIRATLDTFESIPLLGARALTLADLNGLLSALMIGATLAIQLAAPVIIALFLVNVAMGFIARTVPQLNVIVLGFTIKGVLALIVVAAALPVAMGVFIDALETGVVLVGELASSQQSSPQSR